MQWHIRRNSKTDVVITAHLRAMRAACVGCAFADLLANQGRMTMLSNDYEGAVAVLLGSAQDVIRGDTKGVLVDDSPNQDRRTLVLDDIE